MAKNKKNTKKVETSEERSEFQKLSGDGNGAVFDGFIGEKKAKVIVKTNNAVVYDLLVFHNQNAQRANICALALNMRRPRLKTKIAQCKFDYGVYSQMVIDELLEIGFDYFELIKAGSGVTLEMLKVLVPEADVEEAEVFLEEAEE
jgi:hypothetical protein